MIVNYFTEEQFMHDQMTPDDWRSIRRQGFRERARLALWRGIGNALRLMLILAMVAGMLYWVLRLVPVVILWQKFIQLNGGGSHGLTTWA